MAYSLAIYRTSELLHCGGATTVSKNNLCATQAQTISEINSSSEAKNARYHANIDTVFMSNLLDQLRIRLPGENNYANYFYVLVY